MRRSPEARCCTLVAALVATTTAMACSHRGAPSLTPDSGQPMSTMDGAAGAPTPGDARDGAPPDLPADGAAPSALTDPGRILLRRLNRREYDNTAKDLLGVTTTPASLFADDDAS